MGNLADKANSLVGLSRGEYQCNQVVNQIFYDRKNSGKLAKDYLTWGVSTFVPAEGVVVVGNDGVHVGVFVNENEFIHSSLRMQQVIRVNKEQLPFVFPQGYSLRKQQ